MTEYEYMEELEGYMRKTYSDEISIQRGSGAINDYIGGYIGGIPTVMYHISPYQSFEDALFRVARVLIEQINYRKTL
jgi:hypothetical protein